MNTHQHEKEDFYTRLQRVTIIIGDVTLLNLKQGLLVANLMYIYETQPDTVQVQEFFHLIAFPVPLQYLSSGSRTFDKYMQT